MIDDQNLDRRLISNKDDFRLSYHFFTSIINILNYITPVPRGQSRLTITMAVWLIFFLSSMRHMISFFSIKLQYRISC